MYKRRFGTVMPRVRDLCERGLAHFFVVPAREWKQGDLAGLFDRSSDDALVFCAGACLSARANGAFFCDVFPEQVDLFVIDRQGLISTELAKLWL